MPYSFCDFSRCFNSLDLKACDQNEESLFPHASVPHGLLTSGCKVQVLTEISSKVVIYLRFLFSQCMLLPKSSRCRFSMIQGEHDTSSLLHNLFLWKSQGLNCSVSFNPAYSKPVESNIVKQHGYTLRYTSAYMTWPYKPHFHKKVT